MKDPASGIKKIMWSAEETFLEVIYDVNQWLYIIQFSRDLSSSQGFRKTPKREKAKDNLGPMYLILKNHPMRI